jgi:hypothetical protein
MTKIVIENSFERKTIVESNKFIFENLDLFLEDFTEGSYTMITLPTKNESFKLEFNSKIADYVKYLLHKNGREGINDSSYRVSLSSEYVLNFAWDDELIGQIVAGFWVTSEKFVVICAGREQIKPYVKITHWQPWSRTSGSYENAYGNYSNGIDYEYELLDDEGYFYKFIPAINDIESVEKKAYEFICNLELSGAQSRIWKYWYLMKNLNNEVRKISVNIFPERYSDDGYEIESFCVDPSLELSKTILLALTREEALVWLNFINNNYNKQNNPEEYDYLNLIDLIPILTKISEKP